MQLEWGKNNESLTITAGQPFCSEPISRDFDKMTLQLIAKQVCDVHYLKVDMAKRVAMAQRRMHDATSELARCKRGGIFKRFWNFINR